MPGWHPRTMKEKGPSSPAGLRGWGLRHAEAIRAAQAGVGRTRPLPPTQSSQPEGRGGS